MLRSNLFISRFFLLSTEIPNKIIIRLKSDEKTQALKPINKDNSLSNKDNIQFVNNLKIVGDKSEKENYFIEIISRTQNTAMNAHKDLSLSELEKYFHQLKAEEDTIARYNQQYMESRDQLAKIMNTDPADFTDKDIERAIEYLLPSSLSAKQARPTINLPNKILDNNEVNRLDDKGRPLSFLFYTGHSEFYSTMHEIAIHVDNLNELSESKSPDTEKCDVTDFRWLTSNEIRKKLRDKTLTDEMCMNLTNSVKILSEMDYSNKCCDFIRSFCDKLKSVSYEKEISEIIPSADGIKYVKAEGSRKSAKASVILKSPGTGLLTVNGQSILYFKSVIDRHQLLGPLCLTNIVNTVDISGSVKSGGYSSQAGALRLAISKALSYILSPEDVEKMRQAGYLTRDPRVKERKKPGKEGARRGYTWLKR